MGATQAQRAATAALLRTVPGVAAAWLFGSVARGQARADSDVDLAILFTGPDREGQRTDLLAQLGAQFESIWQRPCDVVELWHQGPLFRHSVLAEGALLCDLDPERRIDFEARTTSEYLDFLPTWRLASEHAIDGMLEWLGSRR